MACVQQVATSASGAEVIQSCCKLIRKALLLKSAFLTSLVVWEDVFVVFCSGLCNPFRVLNRLCFGNVGQAEECLPVTWASFVLLFVCLLGTRGS